MSVRRAITEYDGIYFITFTCCHWLKLFEIADAYDAVYRWFNYLKDKGHYIQSAESPRRETPRRRKRIPGAIAGT